MSQFNAGNYVCAIINGLLSSGHHSIDDVKERFKSIFDLADHLVDEHNKRNEEEDMLPEEFEDERQSLTGINPTLQGSKNEES